MKLSECVIDAPLTGVCGIDVDAVIKCWPLTTTLYRYRDRHTIYNRRAGVKVAISRADAMELIQRLRLIESKSSLFANASSYKTQKLLDHETRLNR